MSPERPRKRFVTTQVEVEGRVETKIVELPDRELAPWDASTELSVVGQRLPRVDALEKVTGRAVYTADIVRPGMLYVTIVRAPIAAGRVTAISTEDALQIPGVLEVLVADDLPRPMKLGGVGLLSRDILFPGQPVAAVCAESREAAERGAGAVRLTWKVSAVAATFEAATATGAPRVRGKGNLMRGSPVVIERGDVTAGFAAADVMIEREYRTPSQLHTAMEPHGAVAEWEGDRVVIWESTQGVFRVRNEVAAAMGIAASRVRVIKEHMGGGFGAKNNAGAHTLLAVVLAQRHGRAVRCVLDRTGEQTATGHRPSSRVRVRIGSTREGRLTAIDVVSEVPLGVSGWEASVAAIFHEMYACPNVRTHETFAHVHQQEMQSFRAPGHVEGSFALERAMDTLARELALDPLELRLRNFAERDQGKERPYSSNQLRRCYAEGAERFGWQEREKRRNDVVGDKGVARGGDGGARFESGGAPRGLRRMNRGFGMAAQVWGAGGGPPSYATVRLNTDGSVDVLSGTQDLGTGARTVLAQIAAEALGARVADVRVILGDTERTPYAGNSWGSMTTASVGPAVRTAADEAQSKLREAAGEILECHPDDLIARDSTLTTRDGARRLTFAEVTKTLGNVMIMGHGSRGPNPTGVGLMSFGVQFAEVEVDADTGVVRVVRIVAAHDVGRVINPLLARSQLEGGILQGLGFALSEERLLDGNTGRPVNPSLHDYKVPTFADAPAIDAFFVDTVDVAANHLGARGLAEPPIIPTAGAIANAVADALGVDPRELPLTPWRVLRARQETSAGSTR
ncbi:MAG: xanthine dehydrogenase family protein molybdopterin-binding subunit [Gemmatimonadaceae bacterium]